MMLKKGVSIVGLKPEILVGLMVAQGVYDEFGCDLVVTAGVDGNHKIGSLHYKGLAVDLRTRDLREDEKELVAVLLKERLNGQPDNFAGEFDVVLERTHIHLEFDPK